MFTVSLYGEVFNPFTVC